MAGLEQAPSATRRALATQAAPAERALIRLVHGDVDSRMTDLARATRKRPVDVAQLGQDRHVVGPPTPKRFISAFQPNWRRAYGAQLLIESRELGVERVDDPERDDDLLGAPAGRGCAFSHLEALRWSSDLLGVDTVATGLPHVRRSANAALVRERAPAAGLEKWRSRRWSGAIDDSGTRPIINSSRTRARISVVCSWRAPRSHAGQWLQAGSGDAPAARTRRSSSATNRLSWSSPPARLRAPEPRNCLRTCARQPGAPARILARQTSRSGC